MRHAPARQKILPVQRGIHIGELFYWSPELSSISQYNQKVEVRIDPENPHVVYAKMTVNLFEYSVE